MSHTFRRALLGFFLLLPVPYASAALVVPSGASLSIPSGGGLDLGCTDLDLQGDLSVGPGQISQAASVGIGAAGTLDGGSGSITLGGDWNNAGTFVPGTGTVILADGCGSLPAQLAGNTIFHNLTLISGSGRTFVVPAGSHITVTGTLTLQGTPGMPIQLTSSGPQTAVISLGPDAEVVRSYATVPPTVQIGAVDPTAAIPTLDEYGLAGLALLLAGLAARRIGTSRKRHPAQPE
jgi:hypothetical protein